jgi:hypothetical protein
LVLLRVPCESPALDQVKASRLLSSMEQMRYVEYSEP